MKIIIRNCLALLAGLVLGVVAISVSQMVSMKLHPAPAGFDPNNQEMMKAYIAALPASAFIGVLIGYLIGFIAAVYVATRFSLTSHFRQGVLVAAFFGAASLMNLRAFPHPWWFWLGNVLALFAAVWFGVRWGTPKTKV
ncbi:hypothetical protein [Oleiharenicola lentus]|uniref:hypothetical protein n=1 Tax=Oleiharenicola lentus TaxID=2508720 RepID=UPI003F66F950